MGQGHANRDYWKDAAGQQLVVAARSGRGDNKPKPARWALPCRLCQHDLQQALRQSKARHPDSS